ncbi:ADP-ribosylation factor-like protein 6-interacting protein 4 [Rhinichthys klamathensis goyatoka]|uniref:ADP-ribosylation factor-like protein 6-interacting protein 4 n=1 Tax=Rhinichthys klamathensis goyatoka TaxID=3034132 RepID=UPI0024B59A7A|nr:ADP-ribosylation factor-like protein 6-interacting protein 4 [Rhinichthys klamathensis goyatoka]XP_056088819.1 ADP-ribosylation factor-like protein 6-interacting protein 4 [Rhinichthys klamathensis goyatoka]
MGGSDAESRSKIRTGEESKSQSLSSSSARRPSPSLQKKHERSSEKKKMKRSRSSSSSSSSSTSSSREKKAKKKKKRREEKKLKREKKREKKEKKRQKKLALKAEREAVPAPVPTPVSEEQLTPFLQTWLNEETKEPGPVMTDEQKDTFCTKRPMTKEEYDARQSIIRRVVDPETGRTRLIRGDGEVLEEIVTKERHKDINKQATKGDGDAFQKRLGINR